MPAQYRETIRSLLSYFKGSNSIMLGLECWGLKIPMMECDEILCDVAVVTEYHNVHVLTFATSCSVDVVTHAQSAATALKTRLVLHGGCVEKFTVISHVLDVSQPDVLHEFETQMAVRDIYPAHFSPSRRKFERLVQAAVIFMGSYPARSQRVPSLNQGDHYNFLLTHDQFELLWTQQFTRELWVHGPAGTGKTVAAVQMIQELRRRGCLHDNTLYLAENEKLCDFVRFGVEIFK